MTAETGFRQRIDWGNGGRNGIGVIGVIGLIVLSTIYLISYYVFHTPETMAGFYGLVVAGTILAGYEAYRDNGIVMSWAMTLTAVSGPVVFYGLLRVRESPITIETPLYVYGLGAITFWIPVGILLGTLAYGAGRLLQWKNKPVNGR